MGKEKVVKKVKSAESSTEIITTNFINMIHFINTFINYSLNSFINFYRYSIRIVFVNYSIIFTFKIPLNTKYYLMKEQNCGNDKSKEMIIKYSKNLC